MNRSRPPARVPSLRHLRYFVALAERLNFRAAAEGCFVTQSTLSAGIKELERVLEARLVERDKRSVRLTAAGAAMLPGARRLLADAADLAEQAAAARAPFALPFSLGVIPTIAPFVLPRALPPLRGRHPRLKLYLREDTTARLLARLQGGELDAALIALPFDTGSLIVRELFRDELWLVARADDPLAKRTSVPIERLPEASVILLEEGHCLREHAIAACGAERAAPAALEATSVTTLLQMVEGGLGVTMLPELAIKAGVLNGTRLIARPFAGPAPARTVALVSRVAGPRARELELLAEAIAAVAPAPRPGVAPRRRAARS